MLVLVILAVLVILGLWLLFSAFGFVLHLVAIGFLVGAGIWLFSLIRRHLLQG
jgi:hypothetical protein